MIHNSDYKNLFNYFFPKKIKQFRGLYFNYLHGNHIIYLTCGNSIKIKCLKFNDFPKKKPNFNGKQ